LKAKRDFGYWVAVGFGAGHFPVIAGTVGTIPFWLGVYLFSLWRPPQIITLSVISLMLIFIGFWAATRAEQVLGRHDPKQVVIDEWAGMAVALIGVPPTLKSYIWAFIIFRIFDVVKPVPARQVEQLPGGYGIVLDDVFAGFYALLTFQLLHALWPALF
jgi:phosphatidylglycerophosphatase A